MRASWPAQPPSNHMRAVPKELEHLIREALPADTIASVNLPNPHQNKSLSSHLSAIDARKALEVEHYLRACILRLDIPDSQAHTWRT